jgi:uncharacterized membrane protein YhaH (DUF805 family)
LTIINSYKAFWTNYFNFKERASRSEYWWAALVNGIISLVLNITYVVSTTIPFSAFLAMLFGLVIVIPSLSLTVRRLHDTNKSGWFFLIVFIPVIGSLVILIFTLLPSVDVNNRYDIINKGEIVS